MRIGFQSKVVRLHPRLGLLELVDPNWLEGRPKQELSDHWRYQKLIPSEFGKNEYGEYLFGLAK